jgi:hypothetical protein
MRPHFDSEQFELGASGYWRVCLACHASRTCAEKLSMLRSNLTASSAETTTMTTAVMKLELAARPQRASRVRESLRTNRPAQAAAWRQQLR